MAMEKDTHILVNFDGFFKKPIVIYPDVHKDMNDLRDIIVWIIADAQTHLDSDKLFIVKRTIDHMLHCGTISDEVRGKEVKLSTKIGDFGRRDMDVDGEVYRFAVINVKSPKTIEMLTDVSEMSDPEVPVDSFTYCGHCGASVMPATKVCEHCDCEI